MQKEEATHKQTTTANAIAFHFRPSYARCS